MFDEFKIKFNEPVWHKKAYESWGNTFPPDFFNRKEQARELLSVLQRPEIRKPIIILGERRSGKTSMLRYVVHQLQDTFLPITVPSRGILTAHEFFSELAGELEGVTDIPFRENITQAALVQALRTHYHTKQSKDSIRPLLIWIDELDAIVEHEVASDEDKEKIIGLLQRLVEKADIPCKVLFSITHEIPESPHIRTSPLFSKGRIVIMTPFPEEDALEMVQSMVKDSVPWESVSKRLDWERFCQLSGCWPYYMKALLASLARTDPSAAEGWLARAEKQTLQDRTFVASMRHIYQRHFEDEERAVLLWMVRSEGRLHATSLAATQALLPAADRLVQRFYLRKEEDAYAFRVGLLHDWLETNWGEFNSDWQRLKHKTSPMKANLSRTVAQ